MVWNVFLYLFLACLGIQFIFILFFLLRLAAYKEKKEITSYVPVSVIICAHNELKNLQRLIPKLQAQNYYEFEIVIVNDRSYDGTFDYLRRLKQEMDNLKVVNIYEKSDKLDGKKYGLTLGIKAATYDMVLLTDADCLPMSKNWILRMQSKYKAGREIVLGVSQYYKRKGLLNLFIRYETFYTAMQYFSMALNGLPYMGVGRNLAYNKNLFLDNKGLYPYMDFPGGDDDLFIQKVATGKNTAINYNIQSQTISKPKTTFKSWIKQKKRHLYAGKKYKFSVKCVLALMNLSFLFFLIFLTILLIAGKFYYIVIGGYIIRCFFLMVIYLVIRKKFNFQFPVILFPVFEVLYAIYFIIMGIIAWRSKKVKWN